MTGPRVSAPLPGTPGPGQDGTHVGLSPIEWAQFRTIRWRCLTSAGNGVAVPVTLAATTLAVTFYRHEHNLAYGVQVTPNWNTSVWVTSKAVGGFTINFGSAAPANATVDFSTFRAEP